MGSSPEPEPPQAAASEGLRTVEVLAGVITDARDRVLLARRTEGRDLAGLWEFPGGKREPGETPEEALVRELQEELGITAHVGAHVITVPLRGPARRLRLDVRRVTHWTGIPRGREGQALAWVPAHKLATYAMPPADIPVVAALRQPDRYAVTPGIGGEGEAGWLAALDATLASGVSRLQLRLPDASPEVLRRLASAAAERCRNAGVELLVNADVALARELGTGLHLRSAQLAGLAQRPALVDGMRLAASCHTAADLAHATRLGVDFAVLGPVKPTATHPGAPGIGWDGFADLRETTSLPVYAIGGLGADDIPEARRSGAQGIAAIRGLWRGA